MPKISIIIPVYNVEKYLRECLDSVINQTLNDIEIICIDDGSTDKSGEILDEYAKKDNRVKVFHKQNGGYGSAINYALENVAGEYFGIVESDDFIEPEMYETLYHDAKTHNADIVKGQFYCYMENDGKVQKTIFNNKYFNSAPDCFTVCDYPNVLVGHASIWSAIYRTEFIKSNNIKMFEKNKGRYADQVWRYEAMCLAQKICLENKPMYNYRMFAPGNTTSAKGAKTPDDIFDLYVEINKFFEQHNEIYEKVKEYYFMEILSHTIFNINRCDSSCHKYILEKFQNMFKDQIKYSEIDSMNSIPKRIKKDLKNLMTGKYKIRLNDKKTFLQNIFSVINSRNGLHKIITILFIEFKIQRTIH